MKRREFFKNIGNVGAMGAGALALNMMSNHAKADSASSYGQSMGQSLSGPYIDLMTGPGNKVGYARLNGDLDESKQKYGWFKGFIMAIRPNKPILDALGFQGFGVSRLEKQADGSYAKILREVGLYTDLRTGEVLEEWKNPMTNENVRVVHIANDPFNYVIEDHFPEPPKFGDLNQEEIPKIPFILPWQQRGDRLDMEIHINLFYPNALDPKKWVRESNGPMVQVSEGFAYHVDANKMQDANYSTLPYSGTWNRITPWLPWMHMGQTQGHMMYSAFMGSGEDLEQVHSRQVLDYVEKHYPKYFTAPETYDPNTPSLSSLELYAIEQEPFKG
ncbi:DUF1838 domain-containing protein [Gammaproteobacteria bacterium]|nr:DUF1838 domain-containing protein [Gammaproteobacteria bacterium]